MSLPYASHAVFVGSELGSYKLWSEEFGFTVTIDNAANIALTLTKHHANRTCGLCGNFNTVSADEYTAQEGMHLWESGCCVVAGRWDVRVFKRATRESSLLLLESRKGFESPALSNRKSSNSVQEKITW